jgi:hypothetical protein
MPERCGWRASEQPTMGIAGCCAPDIVGQKPAAQPSVLRKSRRLMFAPSRDKW